jgi:hypothetical protein
MNDKLEIIGKVAVTYFNQFPLDLAVGTEYKRDNF